MHRPPPRLCCSFVVCGPDRLSCAAASPRFYGNAHLSSHKDRIFFLPIFNNSQSKGNHKDIQLVTDYFWHRLVLGINFPFLHAIPPLPRVPTAMAAPARLRLLLTLVQGEADARAGCAGGFPAAPALSPTMPSHWAGFRSFPANFIPGSTRPTRPGSQNLGIENILPALEAFILQPLT